ncbi:YbfB/YjiJ family MFS transporter [Nitrospirillum sp. BR 11164]|uniref:YbfB/YjiJ family MFS transporter n=1 Tax=Nitrospirillum sp. BR 11164 TaxID=3104324 RepID=UPI002AFF0EF5|nr:YbfB/YjiJ family MFS transporter [Nitrospirillum sp. BR 11164]MEA1647458.1 YbfB/YjiJ family MFS transporter [Nitrospirillum sp. BR 11164]
MSTSTTGDGTVPRHAPGLSAASWMAAVAGLSGSLVAVGLARFAYTPLIPPLIDARWFAPGDVVTLGAANFAGYLAGALLGRPLAAGLTSRWVLRLMMLAVTVAFFACAFPLSVAWFFIWRLLSGLAGGAIMVLVATSILPHIPPARRGLVSGIIFLGLGLGIAASGTLVPALLRLGLVQTWVGLGGLSLLLTALSWFGWPAGDAPTPVTTAGEAEGGRTGGILRVLYAEYALNALGLVPVMVLLVDYVARGLGRGADVGASYWVLYGIAAIAGPLISGPMADRLGAGLAYRLSLALLAGAVALLAVSGHPAAIVVATVVLGIFTAGIVPLVLGRIRELLPHSHKRQQAAWSRATTAFALFQALAGYGYSYLFNHSGQNYALIFVCGAVALVVALVADTAAALGGRK